MQCLCHRPPTNQQVTQGNKRDGVATRTRKKQGDSPGKWPRRREWSTRRPANKLIGVVRDMPASIRVTSLVASHPRRARELGGEMEPNAANFIIYNIYTIYIIVGAVGARSSVDLDDQVFAGGLTFSRIALFWHPRQLLRCSL